MLTQRTLPLTGAINVRELGGYAVGPHLRVRDHRLLRSGSLAHLTSVDQQRLVDYGVTTVIDTRSRAEWQPAPDQLPSAIRVCHLPLFDNDETESTQTIQQLNGYYSADASNGYRRMLRVYRRLVLHPQPRRAYRQFFELLAEIGADTTILFHCTSGKDRTGMCTLLLLGALGVSPRQLKQDYLLTNQFCLPRIVQRVREAQRQRMNVNFQSSIIDLSTVSADYFDQALTLINGEFGGIKPYLVDFVGLSPSVIQRLQRIYLTSDLV